MDLLSGYDSNSDDSDGDSNQSPPNQSNIIPSTGKTIISAHVTNKSNNTTKPSTEMPSKKDKKRGKKILKLAAVLPEHIWNQLTGVAAATAEGEDTDDDEENNNTKDENDLATKQQQPPPQQQKPNNQHQALTSDLQSFLQELSQSKASTAASILSSKAKEKNESTTILRVHEEQEECTINSDDHAAAAGATSCQDQQPLGFAFLSSTVQTTRRKRNSQNEDVQDIHAGSATTTAITSKPSQASKGTDDPVRAKSNKLQSNEVPRPTASRSGLLRPAAPLTSHSAFYDTNHHHHQQKQQQQAPPATNNHMLQSACTTPASAAGSNKASKKLSRKRQMEQLLRAGKIHEFEGDHDIDGEAHIYIPPGAEAAAGPSYQAHGVRVVPTTQYNVGAGTTVASTDISGRQRNKHQLNSLLASAASLEAHRMQNPHLGTASRSSSQHRASAKHKYGW
ncbi:hypothetical protein IV203_019821 [Nitzschia inconspicua]|uniref:Uncharacterized protein n=1 Tax=Nitzschia inconspicua TaxID=303405 RepID=A0A9K3K5V4_9STRA|nr:hypothetical protein IV203_020390 [Nitzschia inconspicua]KAG7371251.1 hypothetical protein IV203_019821 [Nitzschia inconspicua]